MNIRIRKLDSDVRLPAYESAGAAGFDLAAAANVTVEPGTVRLVPTGMRASETSHKPIRALAQLREEPPGRCKLALCASQLARGECTHCPARRG